MNDFTIIGSGVAGLCLAYELSARGQALRVIDRAECVGEQSCSWWAGGMLAPECEGVSAEPEIVTQGRKAHAWWKKTGVELNQSGTLVVALERDRRELKSFARRCEAGRFLGAEDIAALEPDLKGCVSHALLVDSESYLDPRASLSHLQCILQERGVVFEHGDVRWETQSSLCGRRIDCRGFAAKDQLPDLRGVKGEMLLVRSSDLNITRPIRLLHPRFPLYIVPRGDGVYMIGATQIESEDRCKITVRSVMELLSAAYALHPAFAQADLIEVGTDVRPAFADHLPRIRHSAQAVHLNGLFRHGFLLAPSLAQMTSDLLLHERKPEAFYEDYR